MIESIERYGEVRDRLMERGGSVLASLEAISKEVESLIRDVGYIRTGGDGCSTATDEKEVA